MAKQEKEDKWFRFYPFDEELITDFLKPKVMGEHLSCDIIKTRQVYGPSSNPWRVFDPNDQNCWLNFPNMKPTEKTVYVFTELSKISSSATSKNTSKKAGCGTWVGKTKRDQIMDGEGNLIGEKRYLVFEINEVDSAEAGDGFYSMQEYSLTGINEGLDSADTTVLCRINYDSSKKATISRKSDTKIVSGSSSQVQNQERSSNNLEGTSSVPAKNMNVLQLDGGVGNWFAPTQFDYSVQGLDDSGTKIVLGSSSEVQNQERSSMNFEGSSSITAENLNVLDGVVANWFAPTQFDYGVQGLDNGGIANYFAPTQFDYGVQGLHDGIFSFDDLGEDFCMDACHTDSLMAYLDSNQEEEPLQDNIVNLGKRKFEDLSS